jgi:hypothetical protein
MQPQLGVGVNNAVAQQTKGSLTAPLASVFPLAGGNGHPLPEPRLLSVSHMMAYFSSSKGAIGKKPLIIKAWVA